MSALASTVVTETARVGLMILSVSTALVLYRIIRGPQKADRIIALDLLSVLVAAMVALYAVFTGGKVFLDIVIVYALVAFLGTVAFARYIERSKGSPQDRRRNRAEGEDHV